ncbi:MAG: DNA primase [Vicinamibacteria bacterium]|nr:DNA primase [Vicinamibacteria bacterium]
MTMFSPSFMDELKSRADIVSVVSEHVVLKKVGRSHKGLCPFHKEKSPSFTVRADPPVFHCFGCGAGGDVVEFVKLKEGLSFKDAIESLARRFGVTIPDLREESPEDRLRVEIEPVLEAAAAHFEHFFWADAGRRAREYLQGRKFSDKTLRFIRAGATRDAWEDLVKLLKVQFREELIEMAGLAIRGQRGLYDRFRNRAMFPILSDRGRVVAFGARALDPADEPKYLNSPEGPAYQKSRTLYGLSWAKEEIRKTGRAIVMEGYLDVARSIEAGVASAVAPCGTALTSQQARLLKRLAPRAVLCFDGDEAGVKATRRSIEIFLDEKMDVRVVALESGHDPDTFIRERGREPFLAKIESAEPAIEWLARLAARENDIESPAGKAAYMNSLLPALGRIESGVERAAWIPRIAQIGRIDPIAASEELARSLGSRQAVSPQAFTPAIRTPTAAPKQELTRSEVWLVALALKSLPDVADAFAELEGLDLSSLRAGSILTALLRFSEAGGEASLGTLQDALPDDEDRRVLREIAVQDLEVEAGSARSCAMSLRKLLLERRLSEIQKALVKGGAGLDIDAVLEEKIRISREIEALRSVS